MANDDSIEINAGLNIEAGKAKDDLGSVSRLMSDSAESAEKMNDSLDGTIERANKLASAAKDLVEALTAGKDVLTIIGSIAQSNASIISSNLQALREALAGAKALGGNMGQALDAMSMVTGGTTGGVPNYATASQDFSGRAGVQTGYDQATLNGAMRMGAQQSAADSAQSSGWTFPGTEPEEATPFGSRRTVDYEGSRGRATFSGVATDFNKIPGTPAQVQIREQLKAYKNLSRINDSTNGSIIPSGKEGRAASNAYSYAMQTLNRTVGRIPVVGKQFVGAVSTALDLNGVNATTIRNSEANNTVTMRDEEGKVLLDEFGRPMTTRINGIPSSGPEKTALDLADKVAKIFGNNLVNAFTKYTGYAGMAASFAEGVASQARQLTGYAQAQGNVFGETDFNRTAGNTWNALVRSDFGLNPNFSFQNVLQNQMSGAALGLKGNQLNNYIGTALQFQGQYGLNAQQTQQILGGGLGIGMSVQGTAGMENEIRFLQNKSSMSSAYSQIASYTGASAAMGMGASTAAAETMGTAAVAFGANNLIAQTAGLTGTELMGTQLGTALFAQNQGVGYMDAYSKMASMSPSAVLSANTQDNVELLTMLGIDVNSISNPRQLYRYAQLLALALPQMGITDIKTPQQAVQWAWLVIRQHKVNSSMGSIPVPGVGIFKDRKLTPAQKAAINKTDNKLTHRVVVAGKAVGAVDLFDPASSSISSFKTSSDTTSNESISLYNQNYDTSGTAAANTLGLLRTNIEDQTFRGRQATAATAAYQSAINAAKSGNFAQAVNIVVSFDKDSSKWLKATQKAANSGASRTSTK